MHSINLSTNGHYLVINSKKYSNFKYSKIVWCLTNNVTRSCFVSALHSLVEINLVGNVT